MTQRTIKFRAWNNGEMFYVENKDGGYLDYFPLRSLLGHNNDFIWMQFTGLLDKNGKEIYEGDLITVRLQIYKVIYSHGAFGIQNIRNEVDTTCFHLIDLRVGHGSEIEIIGNIYENPDLITPI